MMQNLFSVLSEGQIASLTKEERDSLYAIDQKLFPGYDEYVTQHMRAKSDVEKVMERRKKEAEADAEYRQFMESSFC